MLILCYKVPIVSSTIPLQFLNTTILEALLPNDHRHYKSQDTIFQGEFNLLEGKSLLSLGSEVGFATENFVDTNNLRESLVATAKKFLNVPFLWGGRSFFGIDDSGFVQKKGEP